MKELSRPGGGSAYVDPFSSGVQTRAVTAALRASRRPRTTATMASSSLRRFTAEPTPTPAAPAAIAIGTVTADRPEAQSTGAAATRLMLWAAARVGAAFSIRPRLPALKGLALVPPSVWIRLIGSKTTSPILFIMLGLCC